MEKIHIRGVDIAYDVKGEGDECIVFLNEWE